MPNYELNHEHFAARGIQLALIAGHSSCRNSGRWLDLSPNGAHGTLTNMDPATNWVHDGERAALSFDGVDDRVLFDYPVPSRQDFTLFIWFKMAPTFSGFKSLIGKVSSSWNDGWFIQTQRNGYYFYINGNSSNIYSTGVDIPLGEWRCLAITKVYSDDYAIGYLQGDTIPTTHGIRVPNDIIHTAAQGSIANTNIKYWNGSVSMALVYDRVLSAAEIKQLYDETKDGSCGSLFKVV